MARRRRRSARRVISVERVKKEAPARKRVNCLRERGAKRVGGVVGGGVGWGSVALGVEGEGVGVGVGGGGDETGFWDEGVGEGWVAEARRSWIERE